MSFDKITIAGVAPFSTIVLWRCGPELTKPPVSLAYGIRLRMIRGCFMALGQILSLIRTNHG